MPPVKVPSAASGVILNAFFDLVAKYAAEMSKTYRLSLFPILKITHGNHPRLVSLIRTFQCLAVPQQP